jgi:hypothetical protein
MDGFGGILSVLEHFVEMRKCDGQKKNVDIARSQDVEVRGGLNNWKLADFFALFGSGRAKLYINGRKMRKIGGVWGDLEHFVEIWKCDGRKKKNVDIARSQDAEVR